MSRSTTSDVAGAETPAPGVAGADVAGADVAGADVAGADVAGADMAGGDVAGAEDQLRAELHQWLRSVLPEGWMAAVEAGDEDRFATVRGGIDFLTWPAIIGPSGYGAPLWPRRYGGLDGEPWMLGVIRRELARWRLPQIGLNLLGIGMAGPTIIEHGTEAQRDAHLQRILNGEEIWCQLFSEPSAGSDLASLTTRAVRDGDEWVVNGQKVWTTIAQFAHFGMLLARTDPEVPKHDGLTYFVCDMHAPGVEVRPLRQMTGGAEFNEVFLTDVRIADTNRVGAPGDGWRVARTTLMNERLTLSGITLDPASFGAGSRRDPWTSYLEHMPKSHAARTWRERPAPTEAPTEAPREAPTEQEAPMSARDHQRGAFAAVARPPEEPAESASQTQTQTRPAPGSWLPAIRQRLVGIYVEQRVKEMTALRADAARAAGRQPGPEGAVAKIFNAEHTQRRAILPVDAAAMHGVAWLADDRQAAGRAQVFLRSRAATIEGGTSEILRNQVAERILGLPREVDASASVAFSKLGSSPVR